MNSGAKLHFFYRFTKKKLFLQYNKEMGIVTNSLVFKL